MVMDASVATGADNKRYKQDTFFISGGTFSGMSANKLYKFFATANQKEEVLSRGIYETAPKEFNLYCESINYETALLESDVLEEIIKNESQRSYEKTLDKFEENKKREKIVNLVNKFEGKVTPVKKTTKAIVLQAEAAKVETTKAGEVKVEDSGKNI